MTRNKADRSHDGAKPHGPCQCPFCDAPTEEAYPFCKECGRKLRSCPKCGRVLAAGESACPVCKE
ncbi:MAG: zinc ribbon domain-containing protein [bacterium]